MDREIPVLKTWIKYTTALIKPYLRVLRWMPLLKTTHIKSQLEFTRRPSGKRLFRLIWSKWYFLAMTQDATFGRHLSLHIATNTLSPPWSMRVAASCFWDASKQPGPRLVKVEGKMNVAKHKHIRELQLGRFSLQQDMAQSVAQWQHWNGLTTIQWMFPGLSPVDNLNGLLTPTPHTIWAV